MNTTELSEYYQNLLVIQYKGLPKATATVAMMANMGITPQYPSVQVIDFNYVPVSGSFVLSWDGVDSAAINWNDSTATVQSKIRAITGLSAVTVTGSITAPDEPQLVITMYGVEPVPAPFFIVASSTLEGEIPAGQLVTEDDDLIVTESGATISTEAMPVAVIIEISETDLTLPLAIMNGYNLLGPNPAIGVQLDVLGKYAGVTRNGFGFQGQPITLDDADFLQLILMAVVKNNSGSSMSDIVSLLYQNFGLEIIVNDYLNMQMSYLFSQALSSNLVQLFVTEGLLPKPMGVQLSIAYVPVSTTLFGFGGYTLPVNPPNRSPYNTYSSYQSNRQFLSYADAI